jgi:membrane protease subunit HflC
MPTIVAALVLVVALVAYMCTFQVRSTEVAIVKTFGQAQKEPITVDENSRSFFAGLHFKWPRPIQSVEKYDKRLHILEDRIEETPTRDSKQIIVTTYTTWTVSDPYVFHMRYQKIEDGEQALRNRIRSYKKAVIGRYNFSNFVSTRPEDRKLKQIEDELAAAVAPEAKDEFGIQIHSFGIKQISLPESVTEKVFESMKSGQEVKAKQYRAEGKAEGDRIRAEAEGARKRITAVVERRVAAIQSAGLTEVGEIYKEFGEHPELRIFLDKLRALENILRTRTEIFLDQSDTPTDLFDMDGRLDTNEPSLSKEKGTPGSIGAETKPATPAPSGQN